ncbi:hypothetical protein, partial [Staphylococcus aureus]
ANMHRQAVPLMHPEAPFAGTGMQHVGPRDSGAAITAKHRRRVEHVDSHEVLVRRLVEDNGVAHAGELDGYPLAKSKRSHSGTC